MEIIFVFFRTKKWTARGFLIGPWCPIYGFGALFVSILLKKYYSDPVVLFVMSFVGGSILEYFTSYITEKIFHARWWDYSDHKYNVNGRISLTTSLGFGVLGLAITYILNPIIFKFIKFVPHLIFLVLNIILLLAFITDLIISLKIIFNVTTIKFDSNKDVTNEMNEEIKKALKDKSYLSRRLINSFPTLKFLNTKNK
jgi:uncharacterized membrane protein